MAERRYRSPIGIQECIDFVLKFDPNFWNRGLMPGIVNPAKLGPCLLLQSYVQQVLHLRIYRDVWNSVVLRGTWTIGLNRS